MDLINTSNDNFYSLLFVIVNRGKGSRILSYARDIGAKDASCFLGIGTIKNKWLELLEMNEVEKEIITILLPRNNEGKILYEICSEFNLLKENHGIAFTMPLVGIMNIKKDDKLKWDNVTAKEKLGDYTAVFITLDKGMAEDVIEISQDLGYYGGTIIKAHGSANQYSTLLEKYVEPEKEVVLMLMKNDAANHLEKILTERLPFKDSKKSLFTKIDVSKAVGLYNGGNL